MNANRKSMFPIFVAMLSMLAFSGASAKPGDPIPDIDVQLQQGGQVVAKTVTDVHGNFSFKDVAAGTYAVRCVPKSDAHGSAAKGGGITAMDDWEAPVSLQMVVSTRDVSSGMSTGKAMSPRDSSTGQASGKAAAPREAGSGMATGKRMHKPFTITKELGRESPTLAVTVPSDTVADVAGTLVH